MSKEIEMKKYAETYKDNQEFEAKGKTYHRYVVQKIDFPKEFGKKYLSVIWDDNNDPYVVLTQYIGVSEEEKERRKDARKVANLVKQKLKDKIKATKKELRPLMKEFKFKECQDMKIKLDSLVQEYKDKYGRNKK